MTEGKVLYFDDDTGIINNFRTAFSQLGIGLEFCGISDTEKFRGHLSDEEYMKKVRVLIFDLAKSNQEEVSHSFEIKEDIIGNFNNYRMPIFIHSAFAEFFTELDGKGTIFKVEKSGTAIETICEKIKMMDESGFLDIFCPQGILEAAYMKELHSSFTEQFRDNEIEEIIKVIKETCVTADYKKRTREVFTRIAVRSLEHNLSFAIKKENTIAEAQLNAVEHYYRRMSSYNVWTGDIFKKKEAEDNLIVLSPRCNVIRDEYDLILVCKILPCEGTLTKENVERILRDNPQLTGFRYRILTKTPLFKGGKIDFLTHFTIERAVLLSDYERFVTLSDELANDVVRKFCAFFARSGVSETEIEEAKKYLDVLKEKKVV